MKLGQDEISRKFRLLNIVFDKLDLQNLVSKFRFSLFKSVIY